MIVDGLYLDDLVALLALCEHGAIFPEMEIHSLTCGERWIRTETKLAFGLLLGECCIRPFHYALLQYFTLLSGPRFRRNYTFLDYVWCDLVETLLKHV